MLNEEKIRLEHQEADIKSEKRGLIKQVDDLNINVGNKLSLPFIIYSS